MIIKLTEKNYPYKENNWFHDQFLLLIENVR
jgi:hypothetical protein